MYVFSGSQNAVTARAPPLWAVPFEGPDPKAGGIEASPRSGFLAALEEAASAGSGPRPLRVPPLDALCHQGSCQPRCGHDGLWALSFLPSTLVPVYIQVQVLGPCVSFPPSLPSFSHPSSNTHIHSMNTLWQALGGTAVGTRACEDPLVSLQELPSLST